MTRTARAASDVGRVGDTWRGRIKNGPARPDSAQLINVNCGTGETDQFIFVNHETGECTQCGGEVDNIMSLEDELVSLRSCLSKLFRV